MRPTAQSRNTLMSLILKLEYFYAVTDFSLLQPMYSFLKVQKHFSHYGGSRLNFASFQASYWPTFDSHSTGCFTPNIIFAPPETQKFKVMNKKMYPKYVASQFLLLVMILRA